MKPAPRKRMEAGGRKESCKQPAIRRSLQSSCVSSLQDRGGVWRRCVCVCVCVCVWLVGSHQGPEVCALSNHLLSFHPLSPSSSSSLAERQRALFLLAS